MLKSDFCKHDLHGNIQVLCKIFMDFTVNIALLYRRRQLDTICTAYFKYRELSTI